MIRLFDKATNFEFDLDGSERIAITKQQPRIDNFDNFQSDFSVTFDLPLTARNSTFFQNCDLSISNTAIPYFYINIRILSDNIELYPNALLVVREVTETLNSFKKIKVFLLSGVANIKALLNDSTLQDLDTSAIDFNFAGFTSSFFDDNFARGWLFTMVQRYDFVSSQILVESMYADVYAGRIFELIFDNLGIDFEFENEPAEFRKLLISYQGKSTPLPDKDFIKNTKGSITSGAGIGNIFLLQFLVPNPLIWNKRAVNIEILPNNTIQNNFIRTTDVFGLSYTIYKPTETALYKIKLSYKARASDSSRIGFYFGTTFSNDYILSIAYGAPAPSDSFSGEFFVLMLKDVEYSARVDLRTGSIIVGDYIVVSDMVLEIEAVNDIRYWQGEYKINTLLPKIKQWDFIKEMCVRFGVVPIYDLWLNKITFYNYDRLLEYENIQDYSGKVDFSKEQKTSFTFEDFAIENIFKNKEVNDSVLDSASLLVNSNTLERSKDVFNSFFGLPTEYLWAFNIIVPYVPTKVSNNPNSFNIFNLELSDADSDCFRLMVLPQNKANISIAVYNENRDITAILSINQIFVCTFASITWQNILTTKYQVYNVFLDKTQIKEVYLNINELDLLQTDFLKPIYIKELNGFWFLQKLSQFESGTQTTKAELVRLNNVKARTFSIGNGLRFNGVNHFVQTNLSINIANDHSFSFWWKPNLYGGNQRIVASFRLPFNDNGGFIISPTNFLGGFRMYFSVYSPNIGIDNCGIYTQNNIPNALMHVVIVKETQTRANWKIYIDGVQVSVLPLGSTNVAIGTMIGNPMQIGSQNNNNTPNFLLNADLFDLKIFNKALTQPEIDILFTKKGEVVPPTALSNLVADYRLEEKTGFIAADSSPNANNGNLQNYTLAQVSLGAGNFHVDSNGNPILS